MSQTATEALAEAAVLLDRAAQQEGDDGTGGIQTAADIARAIELASSALIPVIESLGDDQ